MLLLNKTALIYGAESALGAAVARAFASEGARLFLGGSALVELRAIAGDLGAAATIDTTPVDAGRARSVERHVERVVERAGRIDIAFNAIALEHRQKGALYDVVTAVRTQFLSTQIVARRMAEKRSGALFTVSASSGDALDFLFRGLAAELAPKGVRLFRVCSDASPLAIVACAAGLKPPSPIQHAAAWPPIGERRVAGHVLQPFRR